MCEKHSANNEEVLREVFNKSDTNGNGAIEVKELVNLMRAAGQTVTRPEAEALIREFDKNANGTLEFQEFVSMMTAFVEKGGHKPQSEKQRIFELLDQNQDGVISKAELKFVMNEILQEGMSDVELDDMMRAADSDHDGVINFEEFNTLAAQMKIFDCGDCK